MNILIIEDETIQNENLAKLIEKSYPSINVFRAYSCRDTRKILNITEVDLFFVDVKLQDGSGIDLVKEVRQMSGYELKGVIFITNQVFQIVDAFKNTHCYDFLVKPYDVKDIKRAIDIFNKNDFHDSFTERAYSIVPIDKNLTFKVYHDDIIFVEYNSRQCIIHTTKNDIICKKLSLGKFYNQIASKTIVQSHKSYIVNTRYIDKIEKEYTKLWTIKFIETEKIAQASVNYIDNVFKALEVNI
ncbi:MULTISPECIES: LytTR family DNA-binding domain-containing protein [Clostridium]|uniref:Stage 0 sporulation protein A homolog n=1 Tax=Clostridium cibarium TaxID=2762247 RepID=A0ABR8PYF2_9CLOT|nr:MULTISPECIES: LytTR family DNA-binding domain-containing protein [Clostridium]MBD7913197.1 response regulator transcription factor [Clostridium cibarium]